MRFLIIISGSDNESVVTNDEKEPLSAVGGGDQPVEDPKDPVAAATITTIAGRASQPPTRRRLLPPTGPARLHDTFTPELRLPILEAWKRSRLLADDYAPLLVQNPWYT